MTDPVQPGDAPAPHAICGAKTRSGAPCAAWPMKGATRCRMHGAAAPQVLAAAERRLQAAAAEQAVATYGLPRDVDPAAALLEELRRTAGHVAWLARKVASMQEKELIWGVTGVTEKGATEFPGTDTASGAVPHVWLELYQREWLLRFKLLGYTDELC